MKLTVEEYSKRFKMSVEMIHSKLRSNKLNYILENGITYIVVPDEDDKKEETARAQSTSDEEKTKLQAKPKITVATLIELYRRENRSLKKKIAQLEAKIDTLIADKERMLREERERIEKVYAAKDKQLKTILELINAKLQLEQEALHNAQELDALPQTAPQRVELKEYLKTLELEPHERKIIKKRFQSVKGSDIRVQEQNGKIYLDFGKYDYSDLLHV